MKLEWKKHEKALYGASRMPALTDIPAQNFIMIRGSGNPNDADFSNRVSTLFSLAYAIKMDYKSTAAQSIGPNGIHDFAVYPLEGIWKQKNDDKKPAAAPKLIKENLEYTIMIRQPDFITAEMVHAALERVMVKKPDLLYEEIVFDTVCDGKCIEILHTGSFDSEPVSFAKMEKFAAENGLRRISDSHREIYLNHANRAKADALKTILRYNVKSF